MSPIIKIDAVTAMVALSKPSIYRLINEGKFPKQIKLSARSSGWLLSEVEQWLEERINDREVC